MVVSLIIIQGDRSMDWNKLIEENATLKRAAAEEEQVWMNDKLFCAEVHFFISRTINDRLSCVRNS